MTPTNPPANDFDYVDCDVPAEQTLAEWRREREAALKAQRRPRRILRRLRLRWARWTS